MRLIRSTRRATLLGGVLALALASSVAAHDCFNASASVQGDFQKAANSQAWLLAVDIRELIATGSSGFFSGVPVLNTCQQQAFLASWATSGLPLVFVTAGKQAVGQGGVIAGNNPNMSGPLGGNNHGIDHFEVAQFAFFAALNAGYDAAFAAAC